MAALGVRRHGNDGTLTAMVTDAHAVSWRRGFADEPVLLIVAIVTELVALLGWEELGQQIPIRRSHAT